MMLYIDIKQFNSRNINQIKTLIIHILKKFARSNLIIIIYYDNGKGINRSRKASRSCRPTSIGSRQLP